MAKKKQKKVEDDVNETTLQKEETPARRRNVRPKRETEKVLTGEKAPKHEKMGLTVGGVKQRPNASRPWEQDNVYARTKKGPQEYRLASRHTANRPD